MLLEGDGRTSDLKDKFESPESNEELEFESIESVYESRNELLQKTGSFPSRLSSVNVRELRIWSHLMKKSVMENFLCSEHSVRRGN